MRRRSTNNTLCNLCNTTGVTCGAGTTNSSGAPEFNPGFKWDSCLSVFSVLCSVCISFFVLFFCPFSFRHCVFRPSAIYGYGLPLCYFKLCYLLEGYAVLLILYHKTYFSYPLWYLQQWTCLSTLKSTFCTCLPKTFKVLFWLFGFQFCFPMSIPNEGYCRNSSCILNYISTFLCKRITIKIQSICFLME
jgi:hypothetical protein